jgi:hypothetical protein
MKVWSIEIGVYIVKNGCTDLLLGSWTKKEFRKQTQVESITFVYLCERLDLCLQKISNLKSKLEFKMMEICMECIRAHCQK